METHKLYRDDPYASECEAEVVAVTPGGIELNQTVFYGEAGGQVGDVGMVAGSTIVDAQHGGGTLVLRKDVPVIKVRTSILHIPDPTSQPVQVGDVVKVAIDWERRYKIMQMHSAAHLVYHFALKDFGPDGSQKLRGNLKGCRIDETSARFDFPGIERLNASDIARIQDESNELAARDLDITYEVDDAEPDLRYWHCGEIAMYCGGTHVRNTREFGRIVVKRRSQGSGLERIYLELAAE